MTTLMHPHHRSATLPTGVDSTRQAQQAFRRQPHGSTTCWDPQKQSEQQVDLRN
ncbi:hypothetical protein [Streptomyces fradiae]|uniref:hypothetical protein n=1 Tax=Streptomyces fradiae TaxID=1906 RepID=UPI0029420D66|nr:hypothetical protein [Streptomyces fradiae]WOI60871.1 hypothetical protein RYQ63_13720 [Streptomyces fradiae]WOI60945.1 hypothetical protein RYQ63_14130 [Streptomyces fradiae]